MAVDLLLPQSSELDDTDLSVRAEELGYDGIWLSELWGTSAVVRLTDIANHTETVDIGTAIVNVFSRTPAVLAMTAASLARISDGRFRLGVGTSTKKVVEDLHGMEWSDPNQFDATTKPSNSPRRFSEGMIASSTRAKSSK